MQTVRSSHPANVAVAKCPACGGQHAFDFQAVIDEVVGVMHLMTSRTETRSCAVSCPTKGTQFMVDVPVTLWSGQTLVNIR
jgi:hypothetical protein